MEPIIGIRFHYMDTKFHVQVKTTAFRHFGERHTAVNIASAFEEVLTEYGISLHSFGYQVTDSASNMIKAFQLFSIHAQESAVHLHQYDDGDNTESPDENDVENGSECMHLDFGEYSELFSEHTSDADASRNESDFEVNVGAGIRLPCIAHSLQLAIKDAVSKVPAAEKLLKEANAVVVFFHRSLYWGGELKKSTGGREHCLHLWSLDGTPISLCYAAWGKSKFGRQLVRRCPELDPLVAAGLSLYHVSL